MAPTRRTSVTEKAPKSLLDPASEDEGKDDHVDARLAADFAVLAALPVDGVTRPSLVGTLQQEVEKIEKGVIGATTIPALAGGSTEAALTGGGTLPLEGSVSREVQAAQAVTDKAARRKLAAEKKKVERAEKAAVKRALEEQAAADAAQAQADADRAAADARAAAEARAAAAAALASTESALSGPAQGAAALGGVQLPAPEDAAAQLEQSLVGACVAAIRRALPAPQQLDLGAIVQALSSGIESGDTMKTFTTVTDDIVVELQRLAEAVDAAPPGQASGRLAALADFIEANLTDVAARVRRLEEQLKIMADRQQEILVGQQEAAASQRVTYDRIVDAITNIGRSKQAGFTTLGPAAVPSSDDTALGRLMSYGLVEGPSAAKRSQETELNPNMERPYKQARQADPVDSGIPNDPAKLGRYRITDTARLICMQASKSNTYFPQQQDVLDALAEAGVEAKMTSIAGKYLMECIAINGGSRCRTWRLVTTTAAAKTAMMRRFEQFKMPLKDAGLEASDWTWGRRY